ncbi:hypothetical protein ES707_18018 [subsurface metagenome]
MPHTVNSANMLSAVSLNNYMFRSLNRNCIGTQEILPSPALEFNLVNCYIITGFINVRRCHLSHKRLMLLQWKR